MAVSDAPDAYINKNVKNPASGRIMNHPDAGRLTLLILSQTPVYIEILLQVSVYMKKHFLPVKKEVFPPVRTEIFLPIGTNPFLPTGMDPLRVPLPALTHIRSSNNTPVQSFSRTHCMCAFNHTIITNSNHTSVLQVLEFRCLNTHKE